MALSQHQIEHYWDGIGGSMAPNVCGMGRLTPYETYLRYVYPETRTTEETEQMLFGNLFEDAIAREAARRWGVKIAKVSKTITHPELPFMRANIDRRVVGKYKGKRTVMEVKNRGLFMGRRYGDDLSDDVQPDEAIQTQHYMAVDGAELALLAVCIGGQMLRRFEIERDQRQIDSIMAIESAFWKCVQERTPPPPETHEDCIALWPEAKLDLLEATPDDVRLIEQLKAAKLQLKAATTTEAALATQVKARLGLHQGLILPGGDKPLCTWKNNKDGVALNITRLRAEFPQAAAAVEETKKGARVLRVAGVIE